MSTARNDSTTETPHFVGKHARQRYKEWLVEDARRRVSEAAAAPALDCADLADAVRDADAAYTLLARLDLVQLTMQAACYAAYANELLGLELRGEDVLTFWNAALVRRGLRAVAR